MSAGRTALLLALLSRLRCAWRNVLERRRRDRELDDELSVTLGLLIEEKARSGMSPEAAERAARLELGSFASLKDGVRDARAGAALDRLLQDLRYGGRLLLRNPTFALVALLTLALGTGANAAIFQLVNAFLLRPLPVERPAELVSIGIEQHGRARMGRREVGRSIFSEPLWQEIRRQHAPFTSVFAWGSGRWDVSTEGEIVWVDGFYVSGSYFDALGVQAHLGRLISEVDDQKGCGSPGAVLSHEYWRAHYGGDRRVIGQTIALDRLRFEIVGVARAGFLGVETGRGFDVALPLCAEPLMRGREAGTGRRDVWWLDIMARLKPAWTVEGAHAHLGGVSRGIFEATVPPTYTANWARDYSAFTLTAASGRAGVSLLPPVAHAALWMLLAATGLVLLLTCANLANLMLARTMARGRELAVRHALGATRKRVIVQLFSESALIAGIGAATGFVLAGWFSRTLVTVLNSGSLPVRIAVDLTFDWRVLLLATAVATLVCVLFGIGPALKVTRRDSVTAMSTARESSDGYDAVRWRRGLVVAQIAFSIVLIVGALLFVRTLRNLNDVDLGFDPSVLVATVDLRRTTVAPTDRMRAFAAIAARLTSVRGVQSAAETVIVPLSGADWNGRIVKGGGVLAGEVHFNAVGIDYFRVLRMPVLRGRTFDRRDRPGGPRAAVVNEAFVRRYFPAAEPLGQTFQIEGPRAWGTPYEIVGLVNDTKFLQIGDERTAAGAGRSAQPSSAGFLPIVYLAASQELIPAPATLRMVIRTGVPAPVITPALTRAITDAAPGAAVSYDAVERYIDTLLLPQRLIAWLSGVFGVLAILIASVGLFGLMSYLVTRRRVEIGVRMALGADAATVVRMILAESAALLAVGLVIGVVLAAVAAPPAASLLYGVQALDSMSFVLGITVLASVTLLASWLPARRASKVAPIVALRE